MHVRRYGVSRQNTSHRDLDQVREIFFNSLTTMMLRSKGICVIVANWDWFLIQHWYAGLQGIGHKINPVGWVKYTQKMNMVASVPMVSSIVNAVPAEYYLNLVDLGFDTQKYPVGWVKFWHIEITIRVNRILTHKNNTVPVEYYLNLVELGWTWTW